MSVDRFVLPAIGAPGPVTFPSIARAALGNGLRIWSIAHTSVPVVTVQLVIRRGAADDPPDRPGLAGVTADLLDEAAGPYDAIQLAEAFARLGSQLAIEVGSDVTTLGFTSLARHFTPALALLAEVVMRPRFADADLTRVRELRLSRLRQLSSSAGAAADRTFYRAVFGQHPYGHGVLGTTPSLTAVTMNDIREFHAARYLPQDATLIVAGDVEHGTIVTGAEQALGAWAGGRAAASNVSVEAPPAGPAPPVLFVPRPGAPQSELRIGHLGPSRDVGAYHALITLNAALGGQFSSRLNATLREKKGLTYGVHTAFDFRRASGTFACETSVQADGTGEAIRDVLAEFEAVRESNPVDEAELSRAKAALTRGYARHFETADQLARASVQLLTYGLDDRTFDRFVPSIDAITAADAAVAAREFVHPDRAIAVVVGDPDHCRPQLEALGRPVADAAPEF
jgi:zinc protease